MEFDATALAETQRALYVLQEAVSDSHDFYISWKILVPSGIILLLSDIFLLDSEDSSKFILTNF